MNKLLLSLLFILLQSSSLFSQTADDLYANYKIAKNNNDFNEQIRILTQMINNFPNLPKDALYGLRGLAYDNLKEYEKSISDYTKYINMNPQDEEAYYYRGNAHYALKDFDNAIKDYTTAISIKPDYTNAYNYRGIVYNDLKEYDNAINDFTKVISYKSDYAEAYNNRGLAYFYKSLYERSISDYIKFAELKPDDAGIYDNIGYSYLRLKDYTNAIASFKKCIEKDKTIFDAMLGLAISFQEQDDLENAKKYLNDAKKVEQRLSEGMAGIEKLENDGWKFTNKKKAELKKLFELVGK
jgi:tetratricopeptide (TPR) repeat protein